MVNRTLNIANIAACVAAAAGITVAGGAASLISAALSGTAVWRGLTSEEKSRAQQVADVFDQHLRQSHLTPNRRIVTAQIVARFPPTLDDMAQGDMNAEKIAESMRAKVQQADTDPAYRTPVALDDYARALRAILPPLLAPRNLSEAAQRELLRTKHETRDLVRAGQEALATEIAYQHRELLSGLLAELNRRSNLPYEVERARAQAKAAIDKKEYDVAREKLSEAAWVTKNTSDQANLDYARSLAALGALAFTVEDFADAREQFSKALELPGIDEERRARYRRSYLIASNAVIARQGAYEEGRNVLDEMVANGVAPNEITYNTLINLAPRYEEGRNVLDEMVANGVAPDAITYSTLVNLAPRYEEGRNVLHEMVANDVAPNEITYSTLINLAPRYEEGRNVLDEMVANGVAPNEITLITILKIGATFDEGCDLARHAREPGREWFTGRGFYTALFARPITHLSAEELLLVYFEMPFKFDTALENPIRQYRRTRQHDEALSLALRFPYLPASGKFFRERADYCMPALELRDKTDKSEVDIHYAYGIAAQLNQIWDLARDQLLIAQKSAEPEAKIADIEKRLAAIAARRGG